MSLKRPQTFERCGACFAQEMRGRSAGRQLTFVAERQKVFGLQPCAETCSQALFAGTLFPLHGGLFAAALDKGLVHVSFKY